ncbi:hypothetical protein [Streptomyces sp. NPDC049881]|uniref:hypothetical protein n=1 Tax=Streptomyces sp. NPDC049881 TaxID=3155778 RepID=UPI003417EB12
MTVGHRSGPAGPTGRIRATGRRAGAVLGVAASVLLCACGGDPAEDRQPPAGSAKTPAPHDRPAGAGELPDVTGLPLTAAQETLDAAGFPGSASHDALGRDRAQLMDGNWVVCFQVPAPGPQRGAAEVDLGVVKSEEECPAEDRSAALPGAGATAPDLVGESVNVARAALDGASDVTARDVSGAGRMILVESNWQVCAQTPAPGLPLEGVAAVLDAVKFGEECP